VQADKRQGKGMTILEMLQIIQRKRKSFTAVKVMCVVKLSRLGRIEFTDKADMQQAEIFETVQRLALAKYGEFDLIEIVETENQPIGETK
jgi:hypothetical protein